MNSALFCDDLFQDKKQIDLVFLSSVKNNFTKLFAEDHTFLVTEDANKCKYSLYSENVEFQLEFILK